MLISNSFLRMHSIATARLDRKGFLKSLGVAAEALVARPATAVLAPDKASPTEVKAPVGGLVARKAAGAVARRGSIV